MKKTNIRDREGLGRTIVAFSVMLLFLLGSVALLGQPAGAVIHSPVAGSASSPGGPFQWNYFDTPSVGETDYQAKSIAYDTKRDGLYLTFNNGHLYRYQGGNWMNWTLDGNPEGDILYEPTHDVLYWGANGGYKLDPNSDTWSLMGHGWKDYGGNVHFDSIEDFAYDSSRDIMYGANIIWGIIRLNDPSASTVSWDYLGYANATGAGHAVSISLDSSGNVLYQGNSWPTAVAVWRLQNPDTSTRPDPHSAFNPDFQDMGLDKQEAMKVCFDPERRVLFAGVDRSASEQEVWAYSGSTWTDTGAPTGGNGATGLYYDVNTNYIFASFFQGGVWYFNPASGAWGSASNEFEDGGGMGDAFVSDPVRGRLFALADLKAEYWRNNSPCNGAWVTDYRSASSTFFFAEGTCRPNFDPYFCIQNPGDTAADVTLTYMKGDGTTATDQVTVAPNSRSTVSPRTKLGTGNDAAHDFSTNVECTNGQTIIAERPMYFNYNGVWTGGHDVVGATSPSTTFFFAEGTCRPNFDPYFCIQNPGDTAADVTLTYMKGDGTTATDQVTVAPNSRSTVSPRTKLGTGNDAAHDFSTNVECTNGQTIIAERPMYFNYNGVWTGGHDVVGATSPSTTFFFAEGTCRPNFDPYFCIQNPGDTAADVTLTYMKGDGTTATDQVTVAPNSRSTVSPRTKLGTGNDAAHDFSTNVECTNGQTIIAERPMYFNYNGVWTGGHDVVGATSPSTTFFFAEGTCRPNFDPYFCIQNPGDTAADVTLTYMKGDGTTATDQVTVAPNSRSTVSPRTKLGTGNDAAHDFSTNVECTNGQTIIAERPMYFNYNGVWTGGHDVVGFTP